MPDEIIRNDEAEIYIVQSKGSKYFRKGTYLIQTAHPDAESVALMRREPGTYHLARWPDFVKGDQFIGYFKKYPGDAQHLLT